MYLTINHILLLFITERRQDSTPEVGIGLQTTLKTSWKGRGFMESLHKTHSPVPRQVTIAKATPGSYGSFPWQQSHDLEVITFFFFFRNFGIIHPLICISLKVGINMIAELLPSCYSGHTAYGAALLHKEQYVCCCCCSLPSPAALARAQLAMDDHTVPSLLPPPIIKGIPPWLEDPAMAQYGCWGSERQELNMGFTWATLQKVQLPATSPRPSGPLTIACPKPAAHLEPPAVLSLTWHLCACLQTPPSQRVLGRP